MASVLLVAAIVGAAPPARAGEIPVDDFESPSAPAPWTFAVLPDGAGGTGALAAAPGRAGQGARLSYDLSAGGSFVSAGRDLATPSAPAAVAFWVKSPPGIRLALRVTDDTGQVLQFNLVRPLEAQDAAAFYRHVVALDARVAGSWGGAGDGVVHPPLHALAILAGDALEPQAKRGSVVIDDVTLHDALGVTLDPTRAPDVPAPPGAGALAPRLGVNVHFAVDDRAMDAARTAGFTWVRMDLPWAEVEPASGTFDFSSYDRLVAAASARAMKVHFILDYGHPVHTGGAATPPRTSAQIAAFGDYAEAAARHFAGTGTTFEVWNEPNLGQFWPPAGSPAEYAALCAPTVARVRKGDPTARVATGGLSGIDLSFLRATLAMGAGAGADAVGGHPYLFNGAGPETTFDAVMLARAVVAEFLPGSPPFWDTEWGYASSFFGSGTSDAARERQGVMVARKLLYAWAIGLPLSVYYDIRDDGTNPANHEHNFGLLANDYAAKPAYEAASALGALAKGRTFVGTFATVPTTLHAMKLEGADDVALLLWSDARDGRVTVGVPEPLAAQDLRGADLSLDDAGPGRRSLVVSEAEGPVYLLFARPPPPEAPDGGDDGGGGFGDAGDGGDAGAGGSKSGCGCATPGAGRVAASAAHPAFALAVAIALALSRTRRGRRPRGS